jgi:hypothetical protein
VKFEQDGKAMFLDIIAKRKEDMVQPLRTHLYSHIRHFSFDSGMNFHMYTGFTRYELTRYRRLPPGYERE